LAYKQAIFEKLCFLAISAPNFDRVETSSYSTGYFFFRPD